MGSRHTLCEVLVLASVTIGCGGEEPTALEEPAARTPDTRSPATAHEVPDSLPPYESVAEEAAPQTDADKIAFILEVQEISESLRSLSDRDRQSALDALDGKQRVFVELLLDGDVRLRTDGAGAIDGQAYPAAWLAPDESPPSPTPPDKP